MAQEKGRWERQEGTLEAEARNEEEMLYAAMQTVSNSIASADSNATELQKAEVRAAIAVEKLLQEYVEAKQAANNEAFGEEKDL